MVNECKKDQNVDLALNAATKLVLKNGIDGTTKEMIARESGLSRKSIDRYFSDKSICMLQIAKRMGAKIRENVTSKYTDEMFTGGRYLGADLFERYILDFKNLFVSNPNVFMFYTEFRIHYTRYGSDVLKEYDELSELSGCKRLLESIFILGQLDGSLSVFSSPSNEAEHFCRTYFSFLGDMSVTFGERKDATLQQIDKFIDRTIKLYRRD
jgi:AcrR family transcriptional regulator